MNDLRIIIWRENSLGDLKTVYCCGWCKKCILKSGIKPSQILTPIVNNGQWTNKFITAIKEHSTPPVLK